MRNLLILLCIVLCLNACKKGEANLPVTTASLSGTWFLQSSKSTTYTNGVLSNTTTNTYNTANVGFGNPDLGLYFSDSTTGTYLQPGLAGIPFTYEISGNSLNLNFGSANLPANQAFPTSLTIKSLTGNQLEVISGISSGNGVVIDDTFTKNESFSN